MKNTVRILLAFAFAFLGMFSTANAQVDYSSFQTGVTGEFAGILAIGLAVAVAVVGLFAAPKGVKFAKRMWAAIAG